MRSVDIGEPKKELIITAPYKVALGNCYDQEYPVFLFRGPFFSGLYRSCSCTHSSLPFIGNIAIGVTGQRNTDVSLCYLQAVFLSSITQVRVTGTEWQE
jgi:hypothetical protein